MAQALAAKRGAHKAVITRKLEEVKRIIEADEPGLVKAEQLCQSLKDKLDTIRDLDEQIFVAIEDETELETAMINADETTSLIYEALVRLDNILATSESTTGGIEEGGT
uniref:Tubulin-specific chaperone A n=1 Tax=Amphimedon queenslandica TaxID=400682 RepID=A0A1X7V7R2_AMPQE